MAENKLLRDEISILKAEIVQLRDTNQKQAIKIEELERRVGMNPRNSSVPPSSEGLRKPNSPSREARRKLGKKRGKQPGDKGFNLAKVENPDEVIVHSPKSCTNCYSDLENAPVTSTDKRQVFELPDIALVVTEHVIETKTCECGSVTQADIPLEAKANTCYGPGIRALAVYLSCYQHIPYDRLARLFNDVFRIQISTGTIKQIVNEAGGALGLFLETVKELLRDAPVVHFDETGLRVEGSLHWVHVASNALYTFLGAHKRRGNVATDEFDIINKMTGVAVHDGFKSYKTYDIVHALCGAHHLRELTSIGEVETQQWANELIDLLIEAKDLVESEIEKGREKLQPKKVRSIKAKYERLIDKGWNANPEPENSKRYGYNKVAANLLKRLDNNRDEVGSLRI